MLTGLPIGAHGIDHDGLWQRTDADGQPIAPDLRGRFLAETLRAAGYRTEGYYTWKYLEPRFGFGDGFDRYERLGHTFLSDPEVGPRVLALEGVARELGATRTELVERGAAGEAVAAELAAVEARLADGAAQARLRAEHPHLFGDIQVADEVVDRGIAALERARSPSSSSCTLFDVHDPYVSPAPFGTRFDPRYGPIDGRRVTASNSPVRPGMDPRDLENLVARYDGGIAWVDSQIGRLLERLDELGLAEDTRVVVTSDHGEEFFEPGGKTHRGSVYPEVLSVPLLVRWPARIAPGTVVSGTAGLVDIVPTVAAAAGVDHGAPTGGRDLLPLIAAGRVPERALTAEVVAEATGGGVLHRSSVVEGARQRVRDVAANAETWGELDLTADQPIPQRPTDPNEARAAFQRALQRLENLRSASPPRVLDASPLTDLEQRGTSMGYAGGDGGDAGGDRSTFEGGVRAPRSGRVAARAARTRQAVRAPTRAGLLARSPAERAGRERLDSPNHSASPGRDAGLGAPVLVTLADADDPGRDRHLVLGASRESRQGVQAIGRQRDVRAHPGADPQVERLIRGHDLRRQDRAAVLERRDHVLVGRREHADFESPARDHHAVEDHVEVPTQLEGDALAPGGSRAECDRGGAL